MDMDIANRYYLYVIEDVAQGVMSKYKLLEKKVLIEVNSLGAGRQIFLGRYWEFLSSK